jgi:hypothetical protein
VQTAFKCLALAVEFSHGLLMVLWGLGLPLLVWHRFARLSRAYVCFSLTFVAVSVVSHQLLGECVLTTVARTLWQSAGSPTESVPFIVTFTNWVAGFSPDSRAAVLIWEFAIALYGIVFLWSGWRRFSSKSPADSALTGPLPSSR